MSSATNPRSVKSRAAHRSMSQSRCAPRIALGLCPPIRSGAAQDPFAERNNHAAVLRDPDELVGALKHFRHKKHEVLVLQVLDPAELNFPFDDVTRIEDMETRREITSDPRAFRKAYLEELEKFLTDFLAANPAVSKEVRHEPLFPTLPH